MQIKSTKNIFWIYVCITALMLPLYSSFLISPLSSIPKTTRKNDFECSSASLLTFKQQFDEQIGSICFGSKIIDNELSENSVSENSNNVSSLTNMRLLQWIKLGVLSFVFFLFPICLSPQFLLREGDFSSFYSKVSLTHSLISPAVAIENYESSTVQAVDLLFSVRDTTMQLEEDLNNGNYPPNLQTTVQQIIKNYNLKKNLDVVKSKGISKKENKDPATQHSNLALEYLYTIIEYNPKIDNYTGKVAPSTIMKPDEIKMAVQALQTSRKEFDQFFSYLDQPLLKSVQEKRSEM